MKVILTKDVDKLGKEDDVREVKTGFARNFLFPGKLAVLANDQNLAVLKHGKDVLKKRLAKEDQVLRELADKLGKSSVNISVKVGDSGKLFGSVTKEDVVSAMKSETGMDIDKNDVSMEDAIKETGVYSIPVKLKSKNFPDKLSREAHVKVWVVESKEK